MSTPNLKHTWSTSIKNDSGAAVLADPPVIFTGDAEVNGSLVVNAGEVGEIDANVPVSKVVSGFISCNQNVTVNTNAADATGGQSIALVAGKAVAWNNGGTMGTDPFTPAITKFFIDNSAGTKAATFRFGFLLQTP